MIRAKLPALKKTLDIDSIEAQAIKKICELPFYFESKVIFTATHCHLVIERDEMHIFSEHFAKTDIIELIDLITEFSEHIVKHPRIRL